MLWSSPIFFFLFFLLAPSKKAAGVQMMELFAEEGKWKRLILTVQLPGVSCLSGCALLHPHHPCFPQVFRKQKDVQNDKALELESELVSSLWHIITTIIEIAQSLSASHSRWELRLPSPGLRPFDGVLLADDGSVKRSDAVTSHNTRWCADRAFSPLFNL